MFYGKNFSLFQRKVHATAQKVSQYSFIPQGQKGNTTKLLTNLYHPLYFGKGFLQKQQDKIGMLKENHFFFYLKEF